MPAPERQFDFSGMPDQIRIGYRTYKIRILDDWDSERSKHFGTIDHAKGEIALCAFMDAEKTANTLLHEILHGCWTSANISQDAPVDKPVELTEEDVTCCLANMVSQVMRDNPKFWVWLTVCASGNQLQSAAGQEANVRVPPKTAREVISSAGAAVKPKARVKAKAKAKAARTAQKAAEAKAKEGDA